MKSLKEGPVRKGGINHLDNVEKPDFFPSAQQHEVVERRKIAKELRREEFRNAMERERTLLNSQFEKPVYIAYVQSKDTGKKTLNGDPMMEFELHVDPFSCLKDLREFEKTLASQDDMYRLADARFLTIQNYSFWEQVVRQLVTQMNQEKIKDESCKSN